MSHGCAASFVLLISVNSNRTNYKILRAESNKRNEKFSATCEQRFKKFQPPPPVQLLDFVRQPFRLLLQFGAFLLQQPGPLQCQVIQRAGFCPLNWHNS